MDDSQKEKLKEYNKQYRKVNQDKYQQYRKAYYAKKKLEKKLNDTYIHEHISAFNLPNKPYNLP